MNASHQDFVTQILYESQIRTRESLRGDPDNPPSRPGVYAWWFREIPELVPIEGTTARDSVRLLYVGISPKKPPKTGKPSSGNIRERIQQHYTGNANGSTLRLSLGCLLNDVLGIQLTVVGSGKRRTFGDGEPVLTAWMADNALVSWIEHPSPWQIEDELLRRISLPLNLDKNEHHVFYPVLSRIRGEAKEEAINTWRSNG